MHIHKKRFVLQVLGGVIVPILAVIGLVANSLNMIIFFKQGQLQRRRR
jgi:hypothetical protein